MHSYSDGFGRTSYSHAALALAALLIENVLSQHIPPLLPHSPINTLALVPPLRFLALFAVLELLFSNIFWRVMALMHCPCIYDFNGSYEAGSAKLIIRQTWHKMAITFEMDGATAKSLSASIITNRLKKGDVELIYSYFAYGSNNGDERQGAHYGTAILKRRHDHNGFEGCYYTEQKSNNYGCFAFQRSESR